MYEPEAAEVEVEVAIPDTVDVEKERGILFSRGER